MFATLVNTWGSKIDFIHAISSHDFFNADLTHFPRNYASVTRVNMYKLSFGTFYVSKNRVRFQVSSDSRGHRISSLIGLTLRNAQTMLVQTHGRLAEHTVMKHVSQQSYLFLCMNINSILLTFILLKRQTLLTFILLLCQNRGQLETFRSQVPWLLQF